MAMDATKLMSLMKAKKASLKKTEKTIKAAPGDNRFVILPGWRKGEEHVWFHDYGQHFVKNSSGEMQAVYVCADKTFGKSCAVCAGLSSAMRMTSDDDMIETLKEANASQGYLLNVLALDTDTPNAPQILQLGKMAYSNLVDIIESWGAGVFDDETPMIVTISRTGKGILTKYNVQISPNKHPMPKGVLAKLNNLDEYVAQESEEGQRKAIGAINNVAGLIAAPAGADRPRIASAKKAEFDAGDDELGGLDEAPAPKAVKAKPAPINDVGLDDELEALLNGTD